MMNDTLNTIKLKTKRTISHILATESTTKHNTHAKTICSISSWNSLTFVELMTHLKAITHYTNFHFYPHSTTLLNPQKTRHTHIENHLFRSNSTYIILLRHFSKLFTQIHITHIYIHSYKYYIHLSCLYIN
jgi:hypothetical protein